MSFKVKCTNFVTQDCLQKSVAGATINLQAEGCNFYVGPQENYLTIAEALVAVNSYLTATGGGGANIHLCAGSYTESFTLPDNVNLSGASANFNIAPPFSGSILSGTITLSGSHELMNLTLLGTAPLVTSTSPGQVRLVNVLGAAGTSTLFDLQGPTVSAYDITTFGGDMLAGTPYMILGAGAHSFHSSIIRNDDALATALLMDVVGTASVDFFQCDLRGALRVYTAGSFLNMYGCTHALAGSPPAAPFLLDMGPPGSGNGQQGQFFHTTFLAGGPAGGSLYDNIPMVGADFSATYGTITCDAFNNPVTIPTVWSGLPFFP